MRKIFLVFFLSLAVSYVAHAEQQGDEDIIGRNLFPPELVMKYQHEIALDSSQQTDIKNEIHKAQSKFLDLQWKLQSEAEQMAKLLKENTVDESKVLMQADKVMNLESEIKKTQLSLLIRIKNKLTEEQRAKLSEFRATASK
jgi:Spy/CpxP family protein refolding chaperone